jgi:hypothetical protein
MLKAFLDFLRRWWGSGSGARPAVGQAEASPLPDNVVKMSPRPWTSGEGDGMEISARQDGSGKLITFKLPETAEKPSEEAGRAGNIMVTIRFSGDASMRLKKLIEDAGCENDEDVFFDALRVYEFLVGLENAGADLFVRGLNEKSVKPLVIFDEE